MSVRMAKKENVCENCKSYTNCVNALFKRKIVRCDNVGTLIKSVIDAIETNELEERTETK